MARKIAYKSGDVIGSLTLIKRIGNLRTEGGNPVFTCECECGRIVRKSPSAVAARASNLKRLSTACCDQCEPSKGFEASDLPLDQVWMKEADRPLSLIDEWLRRSIIWGGFENA